MFHFDDVKNALSLGLEKGAAPGLCAALSKGDFNWTHPLGILKEATDPENPTELDPDFAKVNEDSIYDLASLTKILCTTPLIALAIHRGVLRLDEKVLPLWYDVTIEHILQHRAGLPTWMPFYETVDQSSSTGTQFGKNRVLTQVRQMRPEHPLGKQTLYSDLGFIHLGALLEERLKKPLEVLFAELTETLFQGAELCFYPLQAGLPAAFPQIAATEHCPWRKRVLQGQVHDDNAFAMGGVAGHAGLFGSAKATLKAAQALLTVQKGKSSWEAAQVLRNFMHVPTNKTLRPLGFDRTTQGGSTGEALSANAIGHLGFTGTSLWLDDDCAYILLSNRISPSRSRNGIAELRRTFHQTAHRALHPTSL